MSNCGIYKIINPLGKIYIGQSKNLIGREKSYKKKKCKGQTKLYRSIIKYGWNNHSFEIICNCDIDKLNELEILHISLNDSLNREIGLNIKGGGSNGSLAKRTKIKLSKAHKRNYLLGYLNPMLGKKRLDLIERNKSSKGKIYSDEYKNKMSESCKGRIVSQETKNKNRLVRIGTKWSEETKSKIGLSSKGRNIGRKHSESELSNMKIGAKLFQQRVRQEKLTMIF